MLRASNDRASKLIMALGMATRIFDQGEPLVLYVSPATDCGITGEPWV